MDQPCIAQKSALLAEAAEHGYPVRRPNGDGWQWDLWQPGRALVDVTDAGTRARYGDKLRVLLDPGVGCFRTDFDCPAGRLVPSLPGTYVPRIPRIAGRDQ